MHAACRALVLIPLCTSLSACANAAWLPSFLRSDPPMPMQAAQLQEDEPAPHIIPAAFVQSVPVMTIAAVTPSPSKPAKNKAAKSPTQRVTAANIAALQEPSADGYINAIQVYN